ncbi:hypothetical protein Q1695_002115 [Nippostrongylus brasiliensis]|nr:hypothetical protein Q1695_002115 [Nippostrongylus brasiliensis]
MNSTILDDHAKFMESLLFSLIILGYMACNALSVSKFYLQLLKLDTENVFSIIDTAYQVVYVYLTCTGGFVSDITQFALSCIIVTCLALLLLFNRRLTLSTRGVRPLTHRYQITENIRALRLVAPVVLLDTSVCAVDMLGSVAFDVLPNIDAEIYRRESTYLPAYIVLRAAAILLQYGIPVVIVRDKCMRKTVLYFISKLCKISMEEKTAEVRDVLGAVVPKGASQTDYFNYLQQQWTVGFR